MKLYFLAFICLITAFSAKSEVCNDYMLTLQDFTELKVNDAINVEYRCSTDSAGMVFFRCEPDISSRLVFTSKNKCLSIQVDMLGMSNESLPTIRVYSSSLLKVENSADSTLTIYNNDSVKNFKARIIGNGSLIIKNIKAKSIDAGINTGRGHLVISSATADNVKLNNVGTGSIEAGNLEAKSVKVNLFGTGNIDCYASESITIYGAGSGKVYYTGNPKKVINRSIGIDAIDINDISNK